MKIVVFENDRFDLLYPLTYLRPVFDLRCGAMTLRQKIQEKFPDCELHLETRDVIAPVARDTYGAGAINNKERLAANDDVLLVDAGAIFTGAAADYTRKEFVAATPDGDFIWAYLTAETVRGLAAGSAREMAARAAESIIPEPSDDILVKYPWDLVNANPGQIEADFQRLYAGKASAPLDPGVHVWEGEGRLFVSPEAEVQPATFIDCREGPVVIEAGARILAHCSIQGPAFIGRDSYLFEARIREGTTIGPVCRIGGEIEESIVHGYANKCHTGFLGHAYVGEWVNLGALTTNSDLKNDYSTVSVYVNGKATDTGSMKVGSFIGDHSKTSIGTLLNTGSNIGIMCNLMAGASVLPKYIPSFCWYLEGRISKGLGLAAALDTARAAMGRRGVELTVAMIELIKYTEELTREDKMTKVKRDRKKAFKR